MYETFTVSVTDLSAL